MFKKILRSKPVTIILDVYGIFSLASLLALGIYLRFVVDMLPSCYFTDALIVYVECGKGFVGEGLKAYFQLFSPYLIMWIAPLLIYGLGVALFSFQAVQFLTSFLLSSVILLAIFASFRIVIKISKRLLFKRKSYNHHERVIAFLLLFAVLLPSLLIGAVKFYIEPPKSSHRIVAVDMWHSQLNMPRHYLEDWSLIKIARPALEPKGTLGALIHGRRKSNPFANLYIAYKDIDSSLVEDEKISIRLVPHYILLEDEELVQKRDEYLQSKITKKYRRKAEGFKTDHPLYEPVEISGDWEIYKSATDASGYEPDIYVHKDGQGKVQNILECTPRNHCAIQIGPNYWLMPKCKAEDDCLNCVRRCEDKSFGNNATYVSYFFDKKYMDSYFDRHQKIMNFVQSHTILKDNHTPD